MSTAALSKTSLAVLLGAVVLLAVSVRPGFAHGGFAQASGRDVLVKVVDRGPLVPGHTAMLRVRLTNPYPAAIVVSSLRTELDSGIAGCAATAGVLTRRVHLAAHASRTIVLSVTLSASASNACQGASFAATFAAAAAQG